MSTHFDFMYKNYNVSIATTKKISNILALKKLSTYILVRQPKFWALSYIEKQYKEREDHKFYDSKNKCSFSLY